MLARLRCLGTGAVLGLGLQRAAQMLQDNPEILEQALGTMKGGFFIDPSSAKKDSSSGDGDDTPPPPKKNVALVRMSGQIAPPSGSPFGDSSKINLARFDDSLSSAFKTPNLAAVAIEINSPGGSPVQSALMYNRLRSLKAKHPDVPLHVFCTDVCASGGYYIASAADEIHVLPSSLVGSIGVVAPSVGLSGLLKQYGVDDRTMTAGTSKNADTPLQPLNPIAVAKKQKLLDELHEDFKAAVTAGRGSKLNHAEAAVYARQCGDRKSRADRKEALFDGSVFAGKTAVRLGLADGLYEEMSATLKARFGESVRVREVKAKMGLLEQLKFLQESGAEANASAMWREARMELSRGAGGIGGGGAAVASAVSW